MGSPKQEKMGARHNPVGNDVGMSLYNFKKQFNLNDDIRANFTNLKALLANVKYTEIPMVVEYVKSLSKKYVKNPTYQQKIADILNQYSQKGGSSKKIYKLTTRKAQKLQSKITMKKK